MIYVSSACIHAKKIADILYQYSKAGIKNIELSGGTSYYQNIEKDLKFYSKNYEINYVCHSYFPPPKRDFVVNLAACNDEIYQKSIEHYINCIELLTHIECNVLSIHAGFYVEIVPKQIGKELSSDIIYDKNKSIDRFCSAYSIIDKLCKEHGIALYLENNVLNQRNFERFGKENLLMLTDYDTYEELHRELNFNLLLDLGHLHVSTRTLKKCYEKECEKFAPNVRWLHISENNGILDEHKPLREKSEIMRMYHIFFENRVPITLETNGRMQEILKSVELLESKSEII